MRKNVISQMFVPNIMFQLTEQEAPMLKSIAFVCSKLNDGLSEEQISGYISWGDTFDRKFIRFCLEFALDNKWLVRMNEGDRYSVTALGREFISSQFG
jgi:hypothetical protein